MRRECGGPFLLHHLFCSPAGSYVGSLFNVMEEVIRVVDVLVCARKAGLVMRDVEKKSVDSKCGAWFTSLQADG